MRVLAVNAGSSSLKLSLIEDEETLGSVSLEPGDAAALRRAIADLPDPDAVGHRIVHGGQRFREATRITEEVEAALHELASLAPLHQEKSLGALAAVREVLGGAVPEVACFDTAFHADLPDAAATYALPEAWRQRWPLRRYGFHGLAHASALREAARRLGATPARMVNCHLGAGASLCAMSNGQSVDTTMGFTPLEGLVMATRSGSVDPGLLLWVLEKGELAPAEARDALEHEAGLLALAGTKDMREVVLARHDGDARAELAFEVYVHRVCSGIGAMAASVGGVDVLTFSGGIGENSPEVREAVMSRLDHLGPPASLIVEVREDLEIARAVTSLLS